MPPRPARPGVCLPGRSGRARLPPDARGHADFLAPVALLGSGEHLRDPDGADLARAGRQSLLHPRRRPQRPLPVPGGRGRRNGRPPSAHPRSAAGARRRARRAGPITRSTGSPPRPAIIPPGIIRSGIVPLQPSPHRSFLMRDVLVFVGILALLILGHEFGHFVAARLQGVKVTEFGIGFPPRLLTLFQAGGTRFTVNAIPLGGFVRPAGEDDPSVPGGLAGAPKRTRALVLLAGPGANILLGVLAFTAAYKFAAPDPARVIVTQVAAGSPAEAAGLQRGDLTIRFNDIEINSFETLRDATAANLDTLITLTVLRQGETIKVPITPRSEHPADEGPIGITIGHPTLQTSWPEASVYGVNAAFLQFENMVLFPSRLMQGDVAPEDAS